ncbi:glycosyltransferase family 9 protein [Aestuariibacter salexigens]|uniref:glycosyltransferase family 9 protein n=1 Tax=Aestuariibacter salexigens TaxID=226010 RepID=UPI0004277EE3|nr:hypothetical protein [Aestuariibacter salexigens]
MSDRSGVLIIRMLEVGDVLSIAVPLIRELKKRGESQITLLTHGRGAELVSLAEPDVVTKTLEREVWPDHILSAMEAFLGAAEDIIGLGYQRIINLDTAFMPCFLARFLKDAGEPVEGNLISKSIDSVLTEIQQQTLSADYVNNVDHYLQSTWFGMLRWLTPWWQADTAPEGGYPEFYLKQCCGFNSIDVDMHIGEPGEPDNRTRQVVLALGKPGDMEYYEQQQDLAEKLRASGIPVVFSDDATPFSETLTCLRHSGLLVTTPSVHYWLADAVNCPSVLICTASDPRMLMPDFGNAPGHVPSADELANSIIELLGELH